jgi:lambda repressor-like predicted transcriptional regulator
MAKKPTLPAPCVASALRHALRVEWLRDPTIAAARKLFRACGRSQAEFSRAVGMPERSLRNVLHDDPEFKAAIYE